MFERPSIKTLIERIQSDIESRLPGSSARLRFSVLNVISKVLAGVAHGLYGFLNWIADQILPDTMDESRLRRYGKIFGVSYLSKAKAAGVLTATGTDGSVIDVGEEWQRSDGLTYIVTETATLLNGTAAVNVQAGDYGSIYNADAGTTLSLVSPITGVNPDAAATSAGITGGMDDMDIELYRSRVIERLSTFYTGANAAVYKKWAEEIDGVTRVWIYEATPSPGSVTVLFVCDNQTGSIVPDSSKIAEVTAYLEEHTDPITGQTVGRGVNVTLVVAGPLEQAVNMTIGPLPDTVSIRAAIQAELDDFFERETSPGGAVPISKIRAAISNAAGVNNYLLTTPSVDISVAEGHIAVLGEITWI